MVSHRPTTAALNLLRCLRPSLGLVQRPTCNDDLNENLRGISETFEHQHLNRKLLTTRRSILFFMSFFIHFSSSLALVKSGPFAVYNGSVP